MLQNYARRVLAAAAALAFAAGCSNSSVPQAPAGMRVLSGPVLTGPLIVPAVPRPVNAPRGWPAKKQGQILFVADNSSNSVLMYDPKKVNGPPIGSITTGVNIPAGIAVDKTGALYVTNEGINTLTVYPKGQSSPSLTITKGVTGPYGIGVDSSGEVFVSNLGNNTVVGYKPGKTSPFETISFKIFGQPTGIGIDGKDNIWVAANNDNGFVFEIHAGTKKPVDANLSGIVGPNGIAFGTNDVMYVSDFITSDVEVYPYGSTTPSSTISDGIKHYGPTLNGVTANGDFFQTNQQQNVVGYKKGQTAPFSTLTGGSTPLGVAASPENTK